MSTIPGTLLRWAGGVFAGALIASGTYSAADALSQHTGDVPVQFTTATGVRVLEVHSAGAVSVWSWSTAPEKLRKSGAIGFAGATRTGFASAQITSKRDGEVVRLAGNCGLMVSGTCQTDLEVAVPDGIKVVLRGEGDLTVSGVRASGLAVDARSSTSPVRVSDVTGDVRASSDTAEVRVTNTTGNVEARSSTDLVSVEDISADCTVRTDVAKIEVSGVAGDVNARSDTGDITVFAAVGLPAAHLDIETDTGRPTVAAATDPAGNRTVTIRSGTGDVAYLTR